MLKDHKTILAVLVALSLLSGRAQAEPPKIVAPLPFAGALPAREDLPEFRGDPFSRESPKPQPAARHRAAPPTAAADAVAPANPYRFAGEVGSPGSARRFLVRGNDILEVSSGDVLDGGYRVELAARTEVVLLHLASGLRETLRPGVGGAAVAPAATPIAPPALLLGGPEDRIPPKRS